jgi:hypothetical protein
MREGPGQRADKLNLAIVAATLSGKRVSNGEDRMRFLSQSAALCLFFAFAFACAAPTNAQASAPLPDPRQLMRDVVAHQKQLEKVRENYTYTSQLTEQDLDANGKVTKTESLETESFFVNGHAISRTIKKDGKPLSEHDQQKETEKVTRTVEKAQKTPSDQPLEGQSVSISRILAIMDIGTPRRETFRGRPTIIFDFVGRKDAKTHGFAEEASKKLKGTIWIDEADRQVAHLEVTFYDNFHIAGGLVANVQKGSNFRFDQAPVDSGLWLPTGGEGNVQARIVLVKTMRQHFVERNYDYKRFSVDAQQNKDAKVVNAKP